MAGGLSYAIELACLVALHWGVGLSSEAATAIAFWIGLLTSFFFQKLFAFQDYQKTVRTITHQVVGYGLLVAFNYVFTLLVVAVFPSRLVIISRTLALLITAAWNYFFYKKILFHKDLSGRIAALWTRWRIKLLFGGLATVPLLVFFWGYLSSGQKLIVGDFDYYAQLYEAFRLSVVHYHQFPLWNPWMSGGLPLFANPQFGLFSLQSLLVLPLGAVYGLKLSYVIYAVAGFWGMYILCRRMFASSRLRALLISYIWIFSGFFAGHNISHYTFALFFLLPWLVYFVFRRNNKLSWLWFGLLESLIILSSIHYALLMMAFVLVLYLLVSFLPVESGRRGLALEWQLHLSDLMFGAKALGVIIVLTGYRFITTYSFITANEKSSIVLHDMPNTPVVLLKALFLPIGNHLAVPANLQWGWAEYSMYIGLGAGLALVCAIAMAVIGLARRDFPRVASLRLVVTILLVGVITFFIALGDSSKTSLFHLLRDLPGFSQTRVASRWLVFTMFAVLIFLAVWPRNKKLVNVLLALGVVELFAWNSLIGARAQEVAVPKAHFWPRSTNTTTAASTWTPLPTPCISTTTPPGRTWARYIAMTRRLKPWTAY